MAHKLSGSLSPPTNTIVDRLRYRAAHQGTDLAFAYLVDGEDEVVELTYGQLDRKARAIAARLKTYNIQGERALLLFPPGLDFIAAFFGCLYAGVIAVPAYPPRRNRNMVRIQAIAADADAKIALTVRSDFERVEQMLDDTPLLKSLHWLSTDNILDEDADQWNRPDINEDTLSFLQYTSGSTGTPKGVMLTHANMMHNSALIAYAFEHTRSLKTIFWLPMYHDMGLIGGVLQPLHVGQPNISMSPMAFLQQPYRWLKTISKYQGTVSGGPNFAYELCINKITAEQRDKLDLSSWELAFNGAEPIKPETIERFTEMFEPCGFKREAFYPCYGMAEATLIIAGGMKKSPPVIRVVDGDALDHNNVVDADPDEAGARRIVGCGNCLPDQEIRIVDPQTYSAQSADEVGEIWVKGPSVAQGYWKNEEATKELFQARIADTNEGPYLRTGDLGFIQDGEVFVTGRLKDMIIVRGVNRYPQDIEATVQLSHQVMEDMTVAAVSTEMQGKDRLIIVAEVPRSKRKDYSDVISAIRKEVSLEHELPVDAIALIRKGSLPKTSSGKIQRHACRNNFINNTLTFVERWVSWGEVDVTSEVQRVRVRRAELDSARADAEGLAVSDPQIRERTTKLVMERIRGVARERTQDLDLDTNIINLGLDSLERMEIIASIEDAYGTRFPDHILPSMKTCLQVIEAVELYLGSEPLKVPAPGEIPEEMYSFSALPEYRQVQQTSDQLAELGMPNPYFQIHDTATTNVTTIDGREVINFAGYNYLSYSGCPEINQAAKDAIDQFGTSVSASRLVSGERTVHSELETSIAKFLGTEDAVAMVGGHSTNEMTIGHLLRTGDLILHDSMAHNSIIQGANLSGARRRPFPHNDWEELDEVLQDIRHDYRRVLIVIEGVYGMEGDIPNVPKFIEVKQRHKAWLMIDEAHSIGTIGQSGHGISEHFNIQPDAVDIWMGTLSKALGSSGGYIAGSHELVEYLKYTAPGFVYSVGISPANAAAALAGIRKLTDDTATVRKLQANASMFLKIAKQAGLNTGMSNSTPIIPVIIGDSMITMILAQRLLNQGVYVRPIIYPAVEESAARLRFFINANHTSDQIRKTVNLVQQTCEELLADTASSAS